MSEMIRKNRLFRSRTCFTMPTKIPSDTMHSVVIHYRIMLPLNIDRCNKRLPISKV